MAYQVKLSRRAEKDLASLPRDIRLRIEQSLEGFADDPARGHDVVKVKDSPKLMPRYRLRIGEYRATFFIHHDILIIVVITIGKKKNFHY
jgi:mRNA-degrading endonuclease RelE of RelBE toxin-antitoxin system